MQSVLIGLIVVVLAVLLFMVNTMKRASQVQQPALPQTPPLDVNALVTTIRSTVEAEVRKTAAESLQNSTQQSAEFFSAQARNLDQQTLSVGCIIANKFYFRAINGFIIGASNSKSQ